MAFNMGQPRLAKFKRMIAAIKAGDWDRAAIEALDSRWAAQVGDRATEIAAMLRGHPARTFGLDHFCGSAG